LEAAIRADDWPVGTIVIGGADALSKSNLATLADESGTHLDMIHNGLDRIAQDEWVNCGITWVKAKDRTVERWLHACPLAIIQSSGVCALIDVYSFMAVSVRAARNDAS
jgi:hypothetical protein